MPTRRPRLVYLLSIAYRRLQHWARGQGDDVSLPQAGVLFLLRRDEGMLVSDIARTLDMGLPGTSGLIDRMVRAGLVERRPDSIDGRARRLFLTPDGDVARDAAKAAAKKVQAQLVRGFTPSELKVIERWLEHVSETFRPDADE